MPFLGADMEGGKIVEWLAHPGDAVHHSDIIAVVETEKGAIEIEVFEEGTLGKIVAALGEHRNVGEVLAFIETDTDAVHHSPAAPIQPDIPIRQQGTPHTRPRVSPVALRRAEELGINLATLVGTGHDGAITLADVEQQAQPNDKPAKEIPASDARSKGIDVALMRTAIAASMARSKREIPHYYVSASIDVTKLMAWLGTHNAAAPIEQRVLPIVPLIKAVALAVQKTPTLNGAWVDDRFQQSGDINIGIAIALRGGGLAAPAILGTDGLSIDGLMVKLRDLTGRVRQGNMRGSEIGGGTFTVSSVGEGNVEAVVPIIYPPQVAILGLGSICERPWVIDGDVCPRQVITATLAGDHRASDGRVGARFLEVFDRLLQEPEAL